MIKRVFCIIVLFAFFTSSTHAQRYFGERMHVGSTWANPLTTTGVICTTVGAIAIGVGVVSHFANNDYASGASGVNTSAATIAVGAGLVVTGIALIAVGSSEHMKKRRWTLIAPKGNELGIAFNFRPHHVP